MSKITNGSMKLIKSEITDVIYSTIGTDLPSNFDKIDAGVDAVNNRVNNILTTPVDGVSAQEIIDARGGNPTLGTRLNSMQNQTDVLQDEVDILMTTGVPKLVSFDYDISATVDEQTDFLIPYEFLSLDTDTVEVFVNGIAIPDNYYIITEPVEVDSAITLGYVTLTEGKPAGTIVKVRILKNVPNGDEGSVDGGLITVDSMPINRIKSDELNSFMDNSLSDINTQLNALANERGYINTKKLNEGTDLNTVTNNGLYVGSKLLNSPNNNITWYVIEVFNCGDEDNYVIQRVMGFANAGTATLERRKNLTTWTEWKQLITKSEVTTMLEAYQLKSV